MNNIFNIRRFGLVLSKDFQEKWKRYVLQFLTMFGIMAIVLIWSRYNYYHNIIPNINMNYENIYLLGLASLMFLGFGVFYASTFMEPMQEKTGRIAYLTIPASDFEKFLSRWLIVTVGYIISFFIALWIADAVRVVFLSYRFPRLDIRFLDFSKLVNLEKKDNYSDYVFFSTYFFGFWTGIYALLQSLFILGATFWGKISFVKTFSAITLIVGSFLYLNWQIIKIIYQDMGKFENKVGAFFDSIIPADISPNSVFLIVTCILVFFTLLCWIIAFFRFRESEIIKRI